MGMAEPNKNKEYPDDPCGWLELDNGFMFFVDKEMCEKCMYSSNTYMCYFGWCDKFNKPINLVKYENGECIEQSKHNPQPNGNLQ